MMMMMSSSEAFSSTPSATAPSSSSVIRSSTLLQLHESRYRNPKKPNPNSIPVAKRKRSQPGRPDPEAEVIALSPKSLMTTNRFVCEVCKKGFQRDQNLQLHRRGHNLPWKLRQREKEAVVRKKVYVCPEKSCVHHDASRALGDLTGIKKHYSRKHGEKKLQCQKCSKKYAVQSDWKAHTKICGTREYRCLCGTLFSRKDSFVTHRAFCEALATNSQFQTQLIAASMAAPSLPLCLDQTMNVLGSSPWMNNNNNNNVLLLKKEEEENKLGELLYPSSSSIPVAHMSATALLQKASETESTLIASNNDNAFAGFMLSSSSQLNNHNNNIGCAGLSSFIHDSNLLQHCLQTNNLPGTHLLLQQQHSNHEQVQLALTRDFLGVGMTTKFMNNPMGSLVNLQTNPHRHHHFAP